MKKGCLILVGLLLIAAVVGGGVSFMQANRAFGLSEAEAVSHESVAWKGTKFRFVLKPDKLKEALASYLPKELAQQLPSWMPLSLEDMITKAMPREIALLSGSDYRNARMPLKLFANERRGGPAIVELLNDANVLANVKQVQWDKAAFVLQKRGVLTLDGALSLPDGLEEKVQELWTQPGGKQEPVLIEGDNLLEVALDNRNGELLTLIGTIMAVTGQDWQEMLAIPMVKGMVLPLLPSIFTARVTANLVGTDQMDIQIKLASTEEEQGKLAFLLGMALPQLQDNLQAKYQLKLDGKFTWNKEEQALVGNFSLTGFEKRLRERIKAMTPSPRPSAAPKAA